MNELQDSNTSNFSLTKLSFIELIEVGFSSLLGWILHFAVPSYPYTNETIRRQKSIYFILGLIPISGLKIGELISISKRYTIKNRRILAIIISLIGFFISIPLYFVVFHKSLNVEISLANSIKYNVYSKVNTAE